MTLIGRDLRTRALHETALPPAYDATAMPGASLLGSDGRIYRSERYPTAADPYQWVSAADIAEDVAADLFRAQTDDILIRVNSALSEIEGERYQSLGEALQYLSRRLPTYRAGWQATNSLRIRIELAAGYVADEQLFFSGIDMSSVAVYSVDPTVSVLASALTSMTVAPVSPLGGHSWLFGVNAKLPVFRGTRYIFDGGTLTADPAQSVVYTPKAYGISISNADAQVSAASFDALEVALPARRAGGVEGFHVNVNIRSQARFGFNGAKINNAIETGIRFEPGGAAVGTNFEVTGSGVRSISLSGAGSSFSTGSTATGSDVIAGHYDQDWRRTPGVDGSNDLVISGGATAALNIPTARGGLNIRPWSQLPDGFVADARAPIIPYLSGILEPRPYTVATAPSASANPGAQIYVTNGAAGLPIMAFSDGTTWLRCDTRAAISAT